MKSTILNREQFLKAYPEETYKTRDVLKDFDLKDELSKFVSCYVSVITSNEGGKEYLERSEVFIGAPEDVKKINCMKSSGRYIFSLPQSQFKHVPYEQMNRVKSNFKEPNGVGVLSLSKVAAWVAYLTDVYNAVSKVDKDNEQMKDDFRARLASVKALPGVIRCNESQDKQSGYVESEYFEFSYTITQNWIDQRIRLKKSNGLAIFETLVKSGL